VRGAPPADRDAPGEELPEPRAEEEHERDRHAGRDRGRDDRLGDRRDNDPGEEAEDDARKARHHLDGRLDRRAKSWREELAREDRGEERQRDGEEHGGERRLDGAEDERHEAELGLEVVRSAGRLPDVLRSA
jgi:hypothetical protein